MGFSSLDDMISEATANGKTYRADWMKNYSGGTVVAGRWYDLTSFGGNPAAYVHGNMVYNGNFDGGAGGWTLGSANIVWTAATSLITKSGGSIETLTQNTECVNGVSYSVVYTIGSYAGSGNIVISLGGTNGSNRSANGTYRETIVCGATANAPLVVTIPAAVTGCTIDTIAVTRDLGFTPYEDSGVGREAGFWHGGDVSTDTKHMSSIGAWTQTATGVPTVIQIVDLLGCYPRIVTNSSSSQALNNTLTLPRYTDGKGVRAYYVINTSNGANAQNFSFGSSGYTNSVPTSGRSIGATVANTASAIAGHMSHSGVAAGNFGPFLPLAGGDAGIKSVESAQFSAASASAGFIDLVLCKPIVTIPLTTAFVAAERNLLSQLFSLPQVKDGAVLGMIVQSGAVIAAGTQFQGYSELFWG